MILLNDWGCCPKSLDYLRLHIPKGWAFGTWVCLPPPVSLSALLFPSVALVLLSMLKRFHFGPYSSLVSASGPGLEPGRLRPASPAAPDAESMAHALQAVHPTEPFGRGVGVAQEVWPDAPPLWCGCGGGSEVERREFSSSWPRWSHAACPCRFVWGQMF